MTPTDAPRESAYYYPEPYWLAQEGGWVGAGLRMLPSRATGSAYSYLFRARRELS